MAPQVIPSSTGIFELRDSKPKSSMRDPVTMPAKPEPTQDPEQPDAIPPDPTDKKNKYKLPPGTNPPGIEDPPVNLPRPPFYQAPKPTPDSYIPPRTVAEGPLLPPVSFINRWGPIALGGILLLGAGALFSRERRYQKQLDIDHDKYTQRVALAREKGIVLPSDEKMVIAPGEGGINRGDNKPQLPSNRPGFYETTADIIKTALTTKADLNKTQVSRGADVTIAMNRTGADIHKELLHLQDKVRERYDRKKESEPDKKPELEKEKEEELKKIKEADQKTGNIFNMLQSADDFVRDVARSFHARLDKDITVTELQKTVDLIENKIIEVKSKTEDNINAMLDAELKDPEDARQMRDNIAQAQQKSDEIIEVLGKLRDSFQQKVDRLTQVPAAVASIQKEPGVQLRPHVDKKNYEQLESDDEGAKDIEMADIKQPSAPVQPPNILGVINRPAPYVGQAKDSNIVAEEIESDDDDKQQLIPPPKYRFNYHEIFDDLNPSDFVYTGTVDVPKGRKSIQNGPKNPEIAKLEDALTDPDLYQQELQQYSKIDIVGPKLPKPELIDRLEALNYAISEYEDERERKYGEDQAGITNGEFWASLILVLARPSIPPGYLKP